eukprot:GHRR01029150.1.p1 GENE.GHRR01029150.1~~GHRR01029150.1.p1  ORF type:complete len:120 (-),score=27.91 GHRR01029150.1:240-599(-)
MEDDMDMDLEDEGPIKVVRNYKRQPQRMAVTAGGVQYDPTKFAVSPITGELIAHSDMAEHMRISLLDPRCALVGFWQHSSLLVCVHFGHKSGYSCRSWDSMDYYTSGSRDLSTIMPLSW